MWNQTPGFGPGGVPSFPGFGGPGISGPSFERQQRRQRIGPFIQPIKNNEIPLLNKFELLEMMKDFKKEGNDLFKEKNYMQAGEHYTCSLFLARLIETQHYEDIDKDLLSTLFSNRAACFLKMDIYPTGIEDCDFAISFNKMNIKAYYRKAMALKSLKKFDDAAQVAYRGRQIAVDNDKKLEVNDFDELIREISSHLNPGFKPPDNGSSSVKPPTKPPMSSIKSTTPSQTGLDTAASSNNTPPVSANVSATVKTAVISAKTMMKTTSEADESWLKGTNVNVSKKALDVHERSKSKRQKKKTHSFQEPPKVKTSYKGKYASLDDGDDSDDESSISEDDSGSSDSGVTGSDATNKTSASTSWGDMVEDAQSNNGLEQHASKTNIQQSGAKGTSYISGNMGLDEDFGVAPMRVPVNKSGHSFSQVTPLMGAKISPHLTSTRPPVKTLIPSGPPVYSKHSSFQPLVMNRILPYPFNTKYDFTFACAECYVEAASGYPEITCYPDMPHMCNKDFLIVCNKGSQDGKWFNIRSRPKVQFTGFYRLCQQYMSGESCKVPRPLCSFCHSEAEMHLWTLDRSGQFDMSRFVHEWQAYAISHASPPPKARLPPHLPHGPVNHPPPRPQQLPTATPQYHYPRPSMQPGFPSPETMTRPPPDLTQRPLEAQMVQRYVFPLKETHKFRVVCSECFIPTADEGVYMLKAVNHQCAENLLAVQKKGQHIWLKIRERINHRSFNGNYVMCRFYGTSLCKMQANCMFAHNMEEQVLWTVEKDNIFNINEFILQNRSPQTGRCFSLEDLFKKHPGCFQFLCQACFNSKPCRISIQDGKNPALCSLKTHIWADNILLIHVNIQQIITPINDRPFIHKGAFFLLCHKMQFCSRREKSGCHFAHSMVERDVWLIERDHELNRHDLVQRSQEYLAKMVAEKHGPPPSQDQQSPVRPQAAAPETSLVKAQVPAKPDPCPYRVLEVCNLCLKQGRTVLKDKSKDRCAGSGMGHMWTQNRAYVLMPEKKVIRPLPKKIPSGCRWILCRHVREKRKCDFNLGGYCQFAHSEQEMEVWSWMVKNSVTSLEVLVRSSQEAQKAASKSTTTANVIPKGQAVVWAKPVPVKPFTIAASPFQLNVNALYCHYCGIQSSGQKQWDDHCASDKHRFNLNTDKEHQWNFRQPPWGVRGGNYEICKLHMQKKCRYSDKPDMYNFCKSAHTQDELDEWKERWEWRQMKREIARSEHMYSFMEELLEEYEAAASGIQVISEEVPSVTISCQTELNIYKQEKASSHSWIFDIVTPASKPLHRVGLLHNQDRLHFALVTGDLTQSTQIAQGDAFQDFSRPESYRVNVRFTGGMFGSFMQWVVFDFGSRPVLVRKLGVELGTQSIQDKVKRLRQDLDFDRWTGENRQIVRCGPETQKADTFPQSLLKRYKPPSSASAVVTQDSVATELNRHNYVHKMHKLLELEELTRAQIISSYNLETEIELQQFIQEEGAMIISNDGELFAKVPLNDQLSEDTDAGKLILTSVQSVILAPVNATDDKVYEATMVKKENFDYDGRGRDYIYICLSPRCVHDLELQSGMFLMIEIQFQMDRMPFCRMHFAVEQLENNDVVFPDVSKINSHWNEEKKFKLSSQVLNDDQMTIVEHILAEHRTYAPPIVVFGPFGTGKTETLAQAAMLLVKENYESRVLICTHSNSAADLYITKHFDAFVKKNPKISVLRVYSHDRRINTVSSIVKNHCLLSADKQSFSIPVRENILSHHIIITTLSTSLSMSRLRDLKGFFSHIFVDEAAQAFECEAIMPLALATESTCVVLAGDHLQMGPKVYSQEAKQQKFHRSMLERLFRHYDDFQRGMDCPNPLNILLSINYRTKMEILRFISAIFYGSPKRLHCASNQPDLNDREPLTFFTAHGREVQDADSTTFYNAAEVEEVVDRVVELYENWPEEWGDRKADTIGVVTPYTAQVNRIRMMLRKRRLNGVTVDRVMNIQGKEFRALFLSTVRTIHLADEPPLLSKSVTESDGDVGDFGFLSDNKLLNTALTRVQSFVGVVGDPMALCAIGECVSIWRAYLKHCQQMKSIKPDTVSLQTVRDQVINLMNTPKGQNLQMLNALSQEFKECQTVPEMVSSRPLRPVTQADSSNSANHRINPQASTNSSNTAQSVNTTESKSSALTNGNWGSEHQMEPDDIIKQLAKEALKVCQQELDRNKAMAVMAGDSSVPLIERVTVKQEEGHAVLLYQPPWAETTKKRQLLGADDHDREFDSEEDMETEEEEDTASSSVYVDLTLQQLMAMLQSQPDVYKRCTMHIEHSSRMYATVQNPSCDIKEIIIASRLRCGRAFHGDEVVVELLTDDEEDAQVMGDVDKTVRQGQVVGIIKRAINPQYRSFVCMVEDGNTGLMVPLNRGIPKIFNLETKNHLKKTKRGHVCVYTFGKDRDICFDRYEPIDMSDPMSKLFIVRYLKWDAHCYSPLGIVVGILPAGNTIERGLKILDIEFSIPKKFKDVTEMELKKSFAYFSIPTMEKGRRMDFREPLTFTIDPEGSEDLDDALSIESLKNGQFRVGIHIADVSYFVRQGSPLDEEAKARGCSYYPVGGEPIPMLPKRLSTDLCSLKPKQERLTLSMFITINTSAQLVDTQIRRCIIQSDYRLTYDEVEEILDGEDIDQPVSDELKMSLHRMHKIAQRWRQLRLGNQGLYMNLNAEDAGAPRAHLLVEEMMIKSNHQVAMLLLQHFPQCTPLRTQLPPNEIALDEWRQKNMEIAKNTVALTQPFLYRGNVCLCTAECKCIKSLTDGKDDKIRISLEAWQELMGSVADVDHKVEDLISLAADPENSPDTMVALLQLRSLQERSNYVCSGSTPEDLQLHYNLNMMAYTHFTSPIRRFVDLVVHRLLVALLAKQPSPYKEQEMISICNQCTDASQKAQRYEKATESLQLSALLQEYPASLNPVVELVNDSQIQLRFPKVRGVVSSSRRITMSLLGLSEKPSVAEDSVIVKWQSRIYDVKPDLGASHGGVQRPAILNPDRDVVMVPAEDWRRLLFAIIRGDTEGILKMLVCANEHVENPSLSEEYTEDVSSEVKDMRHTQHYCNYSLKLRPASLIKVQLVSEMSKGMMSPKLQLLEVTPTLDICTEHRSNPALCFANNTCLHASKPQYRDEQSYKNAWLRLLAIESAHGSCNGGDSVIIHNVSISWSQANDITTGTFTLPLSFCVSRQIIFSASTSEEDEEKELVKKENDQFLDYFCVRYPKLTPEDLAINHQERFDIDFELPFTWVGHCLSTKKETNKKSSMVQVTLQLHQSSIEIPDQLLGESCNKTATIEFIPKALPNRRQEAAIRNLDVATGLAKAIALGQKPQDLEESVQSAIKEYKHMEVPNLPEPNQPQQFAIGKALTQPFSLLQGPPGTGKTITGVRIAYLFAQFNKTQPKNKGITPQVLYCGPSNKSVDVVTAYLKKLKGNSPKLVRVYSEAIELQDYPLPTDVVSAKYAKRQDYSMRDDLKDSSLHHMIRNPAMSSVAQLICESDERIRLCQETQEHFTGPELEHYRNMIAHAEVEVLKTCDIILCTCNASSAPKMKYGTNISQLIIDECGMCTEPESMVPIVSSGAGQVVLIGDHKQLRPIVLNDRSRSLGLETSLFERYSSKANMLTQQYRMHESIAEFPSQLFYNSRLDCGSDEQRKPSQLKFWPNGRNKPLSFVHVMGKEVTMTVSTVDGSERSKSNMEEVSQAVRAATLLVRRFHVNPKEVVVMSQYRAQCAEIQKALHQRGEKDINVSTVVAAQGSEWDYVILSTVRSLPKSEIEANPTKGWCRRKLGFITDEHQINVAITRARKGLIFIGNKYLLSCDQLWKKLLLHYQHQRKVVQAGEFMA